MGPLTAGALEGAVEATASLIAAASVLCGALVLLLTRSVRVALPVFLDLLLAAGLLRLSLADSWTAIVTATAVIALRKVTVAGLTKPLASTPGRRWAPAGKPPTPCLEVTDPGLGFVDTGAGRTTDRLRRARMVTPPWGRR